MFNAVLCATLQLRNTYTCTVVYFILLCSKDFWLDVVRELWPIYRPFTLDKYDFHLCSNVTIMADVWAAAYYSHLWSRMLAADVFQAFRKTSESTSDVGAR